MTAHQNTDGTYNGVSILSELSGLSRAEIRWTFERLRHLMREGKSQGEAKAIVREEAKKRPWLEAAQ